MSIVTPAPHSNPTSLPLLFAPAHTRELGERIAQALGTTLARSEEREYENGEHKMRPVDDVRGRDTVVIQSLCGDAQASTSDKLCRLLFFVGALKDAGARTITACIPYLAYARKDRRTKPGDPVTNRYIATMLEALGLTRVMALDVHNEAAFDNAFRCESLRLDATRVFAAAYLARQHDVAELVVASPDIGGVKRAQALRELLAKEHGGTVDFAFMEKRRVAGVVSGEIFSGNVTNRAVVIFDDMIATGTTVLRAAQAARAAGARRIDVMATHAALTPEADALFTSGVVDAVYVSDSIQLPAAFEKYLGGPLHIVDLATFLAQSIAALHANR